MKNPKPLLAKLRCLGMKPFGFFAALRMTFNGTAALVTQRSLFTGITANCWAHSVIPAPERESRRGDMDSQACTGVTREMDKRSLRLLSSCGSKQRPPILAYAVGRYQVLHLLRCEKLYKPVGHVRVGVGEPLRAYRYHGVHVQEGVATFHKRRQVQVFPEGQGTCPRLSAYRRPSHRRGAGRRPCLPPTRGTSRRSSLTVS